jgi:hypothetical protein
VDDDGVMYMMRDEMRDERDEVVVVVVVVDYVGTLPPMQERMRGAGDKTRMDWGIIKDSEGSE